jgi:type II secretory pathway component PulF
MPRTVRLGRRDDLRLALTLRQARARPRRGAAPLALTRDSRRWDAAQDVDPRTGVGGRDILRRATRRRALGGLTGPASRQDARAAPETRPTSVTSGSGDSRAGRIDVANLRLLAELIAAGIAVDEALETLAGLAATSAVRHGLTSVGTNVSAGVPLSVALAPVVPSHVAAIVAGGERIGRIADGLAAAADLAERLADVRGQVRRAMVYPAVVLSVAVLVLLIVATTIVPPLEATFRSLGGELPFPTRLVLAVAGALRSPGAFGVVGAILLARTSFRRLPIDATFRVALRRTLDAAPVLGRIAGEIDVVVATRVVSTVLSSGGSLLDALRLAATSVRLARTALALDGLVEGVATGVGLGHGDHLERLLGPLERSMVLVGEQRGMLALQWARVAGRRLTSLEQRLERIGTVIEPALVVVVGLIAGGAVAALYLPTFRVLELI